MTRAKLFGTVITLAIMILDLNGILMLGILMLLYIRHVRMKFQCNVARYNDSIAERTR